MTGSRSKFEWTPEFDDIHSTVYASKAYQKLFADNDGSEARVLKISSQGEHAYLPLLVKDLGNGAKEAYSAYGYGGLMGSVNLSEADVESLRNYLSDDSILAMFIRHSPFLNNHEQWPASSVALNRYTYKADLLSHNSFEEYLKTIPQKIRWSANYAIRSGLKISFHKLSECPHSKIMAFSHLYTSMLEKKNTSAYYFFEPKFFINFAESLGNSCEFVEIVDSKNENLCAGAFFLLDTDKWAHYHFSAVKKDMMNLQAMELLMTSAVYRYGRAGYQALYLGGGHSLDENDGLSRFKKKFASTKEKFFCTKTICQELKYKKERNRLQLKSPKFFLISDARNL